MIEMKHLQLSAIKNIRALSFNPQSLSDWPDTSASLKLQRQQKPLTPQETDEIAAAFRRVIHYMQVQLSQPDSTPRQIL